MEDQELRERLERLERLVLLATGTIVNQVIMTGNVEDGYGDEQAIDEALQLRMLEKRAKLDR